MQCRLFGGLGSNPSIDETQGDVFLKTTSSFLFDGSRNLQGNGTSFCYPSMPQHALEFRVPWHETEHVSSRISCRVSLCGGPPTLVSMYTQVSFLLNRVRVHGPVFLSLVIHSLPSKKAFSNSSDRDQNFPITVQYPSPKVYRGNIFHKLT